MLRRPEVTKLVNQAVGKGGAPCIALLFNVRSAESDKTKLKDQYRKGLESKCKTRL